MKTYINRFFAMALLAGTIVTTFEACKIKNPTEGIAIYMKPDAVSAPNSFGFIDSKTGFTKSDLEGFEVTITGPSSGSLFTTDGYRTFKIVNGQIGVCVRRGLNPTPANPLKFDIIFDKPGYLTKTTHVELTSLIPISQSISVLTLSDLPKTASKKDTTFTVPSGGLATPVTISTPSTDSLPATSITMPVGTQFVDENNVPFVGTLSFNMLNSKSSGEDLGASPFGFDVPNLVDGNGTPITNTAFVPFNTYQLNISGGGKALKAYSADKSLAINPYEIFSNRIVMGNNRPPSMVADTGDMPKGGTTSYNGYPLTYKNAILNFTNKQYIDQYIFVLKNMIQKKGSMGYSVQTFSIRPTGDGFNAQIFSGSNPDYIATTSLELKYKNGKLASKIVLEEGTNTIDLPKPPGNQNYFISKFSIKCSNDGSFVILPEGWSIYLIKRDNYFNTIVNGHRVQPADKTDDYIVGNAGAPVTEKDADGNEVIYNYVKIPINSLEDNTEYIVCTYFGSKGLIFNDFNSETGKLVTPAGMQSAPQDFEDTPKSMSVKCN